MRVVRHSSTIQIERPPQPFRIILFFSFFKYAHLALSNACSSQRHFESGAWEEALLGDAQRQINSGSSSSAWRSFSQTMPGETLCVLQNEEAQKTEAYWQELWHQTQLEGNSIFGKQFSLPRSHCRKSDDEVRKGGQVPRRSVHLGRPRRKLGGLEPQMESSCSKMIISSRSKQANGQCGVWEAQSWQRSISNGVRFLRLSSVLERKLDVRSFRRLSRQVDRESSTRRMKRQIHRLRFQRQSWYYFHTAAGDDQTARLADSRRPLSGMRS